MPIIFLCLLVFVQSSIFSLSFENHSGSMQSLSAYQGKKILFVNIATGSSRVGQLAALQQLQQQYSDSITVIAFPSNSFGNETRSDSAIAQFCQGYGISFSISKKIQLAGSGQHAIYHWLTTASENGATSDPIKGDFQKMLVDREGRLIGIFSPSVDPMSAELVNAILQ
jgi:glutathione peroxidase